MAAYDDLDGKEYAGVLRRAPAYLLDVAIVAVFVTALQVLVAPRILEVTREREVAVSADLGDGVEIWMATAIERRGLLCARDSPVVTFSIGAALKTEGELRAFHRQASACGEAEALRARLLLEDGRASADWPIATQEDLFAFGAAAFETYDRGSLTDPMEVLRSITIPATEGDPAVMSGILLVLAETGAPAPKPWLVVRWLSTVLTLALFFLYFLLLEHFTTAGSLGKMAFRCAVVTKDRTRPPFGASLARTAMKCFLPILTVVTVPFSRRRRALHDMVAGTFVVRRRALVKKQG